MTPIGTNGPATPATSCSAPDATRRGVVGTTTVAGFGPLRSGAVEVAETGFGARIDVRLPAMTTYLPSPFDLSVDRIAGFCNAELSDDPTYDGIEVQWFDDAAHGRGLLVFLQRRSSGLVDYYHAPGLRLDRAAYELGSGTGSWSQAVFDPGRLEIGPEGIDCHVGFVDRDGRTIEVRIDDRRPGTRSTGRLLAPVGSGIEQPASLLLVHLHGFDLVRAGDTPPRISIDGRPAATGRLPGQRLQRRELVKYAAPLDTITFNRTQDGPLAAVADGDGTRLEDGGIAVLAAGDPRYPVTARFRPVFPDLTAVADGCDLTGRWRIYPAGSPPLCGGTWRVQRDGDRVDVDLEVVEGWRPGPLPPLVRTVTTLVPVFRRWPTTYRWSATVLLGDEPRIRSRWERVGGGDDSYRRATGRR